MCDGEDRGHLRPPGRARLCAQQGFSNSRALPALSQSRERQGWAAGWVGMSADPTLCSDPDYPVGHFSFRDRGQPQPPLQPSTAPGESLDGGDRGSVIFP